MNLSLTKINPPASAEMQIDKEAFSSLNVRTGFLLAILANIIWGASFLASKYTLQAWGPFTASSLRFGIATVALFIVLTLMGRKIVIPTKKGHWLSLITIATSGFGLLYPLQLGGLQYITSSLSAAIMLTSPLLVLVLGKVILKESLTTQKWVALSIGVFGGSILLSAQKSSGIDITSSKEFILGSLMTLAASLSLAISVIGTRKLSKELSTPSITVWTMAIGFLELTVAAFIFEENILASLTRNASLISWMALFFLALVCSAFCFFIWNSALAMTSPQEIASSMHVKTPTAVLIGISIANESLSMEIIFGTVLVMSGVWLSQQKTIWRIK